MLCSGLWCAQHRSAAAGSMHSSDINLQRQVVVEGKDEMLEGCFMMQLWWVYPMNMGYLELTVVGIVSFQKILIMSQQQYEVGAHQGEGCEVVISPVKISTESINLKEKR